MAPNEESEQLNPLKRQLSKPDDDSIKIPEQQLTLTELKEHNKFLQDQNSALTDENMRLKSSLHSVKQELEEVQYEYEELLTSKQLVSFQKVPQYKAQYVAVLAQYNNLKSQVDDFHAEKRQLQSKLKEGERLIADFKRRMSKPECIEGNIKNIELTKRNLKL